MTIDLKQFPVQKYRHIEFVDCDGLLFRVYRPFNSEPLFFMPIRGLDEEVRNDLKKFVPDRLVVFPTSEFDHDQYRETYQDNSSHSYHETPKE